MSRGITKSKLKESYPSLADALDQIESTNKKKHYWFFTNYGGNYKTPSGLRRTVSFGAILDVLQENGYDVQITVSHP